MKKNLTLLFVFVFGFIFSQEKDSISRKTPKLNIYFGINGQVLDYKINNNLSAQNLPKINNVGLFFNVGLSVFGEKYSGDIEFGASQSDKENNSNSNRMLSYNATARVHYNLINKEKIAFTSGINLSFQRNELDLFNSNAVVDLNNLNALNGSNNISLRNNMLYVGPSASLYLFKNKTFPLRLNVAYEFGITRGRWNTDFGSVSNTINESGRNRFVIGLTIL